LGQFYLDGPVRNLKTFDFGALPRDAERLWIVEDMNTGLALPAQAAWIQANARLVASFDVHASARNFWMRVYLYAP
jgi:hypothetical protein